MKKTFSLFNFDKVWVNTLREIKPIWRCKRLVIKPLGFTIILLPPLVGIRYWLPFLFMDEMGSLAEVFVALVFAFIGFIHGLFISDSIASINRQMRAIFHAIDQMDWESFKIHFHDRIFPHTKLLIFFLSMLMTYCAASCNLGSFKNNVIVVGIVLFTIVLCWTIAYEMDNPMSPVWRLRERIPKEWEDKLEAEIRVYENTCSL